MSDRIGRATAIMAVGTMLSRATGFVRAAVIAATLGLGLTGDMFAVADALPAAMYTIVAGGVLNAVLVPQLVRSMQRDADGGEAYAQRLASAVLLLLAVTTVLLVAAAPVVTGLYTSADFDSPALAAQRDMIVTLARFTLVQVFFYGFYTLLGQMLNARGRFGPMMFAPILNNLIAIAVFGSFLAVMGPLDPRAGEFTPAQAAWFGLGSTVGIAVQALVLLPLLRRSGLRLRLRTDLRGVGLGKAFRLGAWTVGLITIMQVTQIVVIRLATSATAVAAATDAGRGAGIAVYNNAFLIIMVPHSIITVSLATALLPDLSRTAAAAQTELLRNRVMGALRVALAVIIPFAGLLAAVAGPISVLLFGYGAATDDVDLVALTLALFVPGLVGFTTTFLVQRAFYAQEDTRTPVLVQLIVSAVQISLSVTIVPRIDPQLVSAALAGCWSVATLTGALASMWLLHRRLGRLGGLRFTGFVLAVGIAALPGTILALGLTLRYPQIAVGSPLGPLATLAAGTAIAASVYVLVAWLVRIGPVRDAVAAVVDVVRTRIGARR